MPRLTLKLSGSRRLVRTDLEVEGRHTQADLERAAKAAAGELEAPKKKRANRDGRKARTGGEHVATPKPEES